MIEVQPYTTMKGSYTYHAILQPKCPLPLIGNLEVTWKLHSCFEQFIEIRLKRLSALSSAKVLNSRNLGHSVKSPLRKMEKSVLYQKTRNWLWIRDLTTKGPLKLTLGGRKNTALNAVIILCTILRTKFCSSHPYTCRCQKQCKSLHLPLWTLHCSHIIPCAI